MYCRLLVLPLIDIQIFVNEDANRATEVDRAIAGWLPTLYWGLAIFAHIFFIAAILDGYINRRKSVLKMVSTQ
jgi:hypothetical protein